MKTQHKLDSFTRAYIEAALWSSTEYAYGDCPCCGQPSILSHYPEPEYDQEAMCSECGAKEIANPEPMDSNYGLEDLSYEALDRIIEDCAKFQAENETPDYGERGASNGGDAACAGHDFWLTRVGAGVGFWDRDLGEIGKKLTDAARAFGQVYLYVGDDGKLHIA